MSSVTYIDNSYLLGPRTFQPIGVRKFWNSDLRTPAISSLVGLALLAVTFYPSLDLGTQKIYVSSYPQQIADQTQAQTQQATVAKVVSTEEVKAEEASNFTPQDIPELNLSGEKSWPLRGTLTTYYSWYHPGIDIATSYGTAIRPFMEGVVKDVEHTGVGFGNFVVISHADGIETTYAHMSRTNVEIGQRVGAGTVIGFVGTSGRATGPHLHFQIEQNGQTLNPLSALP